MAKVAPVHHIGEPSYAPSRGFDSSARNPVTEAPSLPEVPPFNPNAFGLAPARHAGLVAAVALSTFLATRLVSKEVQKASAGFVDRKTLEAAKAELAQFDEKTKAHVQALENDLKRMSAELALSKATAESLKVAAAKPEPAKAEAKGKAKKAVVAKAKSGSGMTAMAKAAARGAAMRKKAKLAAASRDSESDAVAESGYSESSRGVPEPPGLEDLPPPPSE
jgi:hypothetical protein